jgi:hypothetical protein
LLLALLALAINVLVPQGFMVGAGQAGPAIEICTGAGPLVVTPTSDQHGHKTGGTHGEACAFAGHGVASAPPILAVIARPEIPASAPNAPRLADLAPGRGLAAPPPPSRGPPLLT